ncbi:hypothetical protein KFE25_000607 [Diacronema lutheri]|uniref:Acyltransferase n=1 Tax=Diacronema lutheri TaxID=2081491 RepID=A0A8J5XEI5_DIALT|nr:hypothetical protein KFE25_000607 [Diacronema lutheri]
MERGIVHAGGNAQVRARSTGAGPRRRVSDVLGSQCNDFFHFCNEFSPIAALPPIIANLKILAATSARRVLALCALALLLAAARAPGDAHRRTASWGPRWLALFAARLLTASAHAIGVEHDVAWPPGAIDPHQQCVVVWHPHGALTFSALFFGALLSIRRQPVRWRTAVASLLFRVPLLREVLLLVGAREVTPGVMRALLAAGHSVGVQPGGIPEQLRTSQTREHAFFPPNLTFVRLAIEHGTPLLPVYLFGENQLFSTRPALQRLARAVHARFGLPAIIPLGRWGLPWPVPRRARVHIRFGRPVPVGPACARPSEEVVNEVFARYTAELRRLFDEHKALLPAGVAARGLTIVRRVRPAGRL